MSIYERGSVNIWEIIVVVVFTSVLFIAGMYIWGQYKVAQVEAVMVEKVPASVIEEFSSFKVRFSQNMISRCETEIGKLYLLSGRSAGTAQIMTFDADGIIVQSAKNNDRSFEELQNNLARADCQALQIPAE